jgi:hypothetical protein
MKRYLEKALGSLAVGLIFAVSAGGCAARPAPRPAPNAGPGFAGANLSGIADPTTSSAVANIVRGVGGTGTSEAIVFGNAALVAIRLNTPQPGATNGGSTTGRIHDVDYPGSSPSGGPSYVQGPGGSSGTAAARPGGGFSPVTIPGGSPNSTQAVPNASGNLADLGQSNTSPAPGPGVAGYTPMDVMTRVADHVKARHPGIVEVRFATSPDDARRISSLALAMQTGAAVDQNELRTLWERAIPAGTEPMTPNYPSQGSYPTPRR